MSNELSWAAVIVFLVLLGILRPRWLLYILLFAFFASVAGFFVIMLLIALGKFMGGGKK